MTIFICGDSTAATFNPSETPIVGWGQLLANHLPAGIRVDNHAMAGRSTRTVSRLVKIVALFSVAQRRI